MAKKRSSDHIKKEYPNIVYRRVDYRVSIYDAWNIGVTLARGKYLTNTNADDLRRRDLFELQAGARDAGYADVIYQIFYYTLDPALNV